MKHILPVSLFALVVSTLLIYYLSIQNHIASDGRHDKDFTCFNRSDADNAKAIFTFWTVDTKRTTAIKDLIALDFIFMFLYCSYFCFVFYRLLKNKSNISYQRILKFGITAVLLGTLLDAIQDARILSFFGNPAAVGDMRWFTFPKFLLLVLGVATIPLVFLLKHPFSGQQLRGIVNRLLKFLSQLLKSIWIFFPGMFFLLLAIFFFWMLGQGKDIIVAFTENSARSETWGIISWNYTRLVFFMAIAFWVYVSWYSSRIIYYIKIKKQEDVIDEIRKSVIAPVPDCGQTYPEINEHFLVEFPRLIGNACFLVLELAVLQSPLVNFPISSGLAWMLLLELLLVFYFLNSWVYSKMTKVTVAKTMVFRSYFFRLLFFFLFCLLITCFFKSVYFLVILGLLLLLHVVFIFYINLRRVDLNIQANVSPSNKRKPWIESIMHYFCIPIKELGYFSWFLYISLGGILVYFLTIKWLYFARHIGPFPFIIVAFGVLLAFGNLVTAFSAKYKVNFHFLLLLLAFLIGFGENHWVRTRSVTENYPPRVGFQNYLQTWLKRYDPEGAMPKIDMYFVMANGGASRSGYWTAAVLGRLEDSTRFSDKLFCLSGTSGGGVGLASYFAALRDKDPAKKGRYESSLKRFLKKDYFSFTFARLLGPDFFNYIFHFKAMMDRGTALEESFEKSTAPEVAGDFNIPFDNDFSSFPACKDNQVYLPILCINTTRMQDGNPGIVTNLSMDKKIFNNRVDVLTLLPPKTDISMASGAILGARFPYLSPAGRIQDNYFVDGGYFDNSGAGVVQELIRAIINTGKAARERHEPIGEQIAKIHFHVLHILNSPIDVESSNFKAVSSIKNDLLAPILTIVGAYDMQTTVNDARLINYISDIRTYEKIPADYTRISLYKGREEWAVERSQGIAFQAEAPYAMNWFMSDTTSCRIDKRLIENESLKTIIRKLAE